MWFDMILQTCLDLFWSSKNWCDLIQFCQHVKTCFEILKSDANWYNCTNMSRLFLNTYNVISCRNTLKFEQMAQRMVRQQSDSWIALSKSSDQKPL